MQAYNSSYKDLGFLKTSQILAKNRGGFLSLFRGVKALALGAAPAHAAQFASYEFFKKQLGSNANDQHTPLVNAVCGSLATAISDGIMTPAETVKQKLQLGKKEYQGFIGCFKTVVQTEGVRALYASYTTTFFMNLPYTATHFAIYEFLRKVLKTDSESVFQLEVHLASGGIAAGTAAALTTPLDVVKTRLQTQADVGKTYSGGLNAFQTIAKEEGFSALFRGIKPRVLLHSVAGAITWMTYEFVKFTLQF